MTRIGYSAAGQRAGRSNPQKNSKYSRISQSVTSPAEPGPASASASAPVAPAAASYRATSAALHHHQVVDQRVTEDRTEEAVLVKRLDCLGERGGKWWRGLGPRTGRIRLAVAESARTCQAVHARGDVGGQVQVRVRGSLAHPVLDVRARVPGAALHPDQRAAVLHRPGRPGPARTSTAGTACSRSPSAPRTAATAPRALGSPATHAFPRLDSGTGPRRRTAFNAREEARNTLGATGAGATPRRRSWAGRAWT